MLREGFVIIKTEINLFDPDISIDLNDLKFTTTYNGYFNFFIHLLIY